MIKRGNRQHTSFHAFVKLTWRRKTRTWHISVQGHTLWPKPCSNKSTLHKNHLLMNQSRWQTLSKFYMKYIPRCTQHKPSYQADSSAVLPIKSQHKFIASIKHQNVLRCYSNILGPSCCFWKELEARPQCRLHRGIRTHCIFLSSKYFFSWGPLWAWE